TAPLRTRSRMHEFLPAGAPSPELGDPTPPRLPLSAAAPRVAGVRAVGLAVEDQRGVDQREMRQGLREVAELRARDWVVLLGQEAEIVRHVQQRVEQLVRLDDLALEGEDGDEPERAGQEHPLARWQAVDVDPGLGPVTEEERAEPQLFPDRRNRRDHPG